MPMEITRNEAKRLMEGAAIGVTRWYDGACPHAVGGQVLLAFGHGPDGKPNIVAKGTVVSVRPFEVRERRANTPEAREEAAKEGWASPAEWWGHFTLMYGELPDSAVLHRIQLRVEARVDGAQDTGEAMPMLK